MVESSQSEQSAAARLAQLPKLHPGEEMNDGFQTAHVSDNTVAVSGELSIECVFNCKLCTYFAERRGCVED